MVGKKDRTEEDIIAQAPITVILGGKKYDIKPLVLRDSREWRKKYAEYTAPLFSMIDKTTDNPEDFVETYKQMLTQKPDEVLDLFFLYANDLNREEIEGIATEAEIAVAFQEVVKIALPLAESLPKSMARF